jgi:hypothetical protein
MTSMVYGNVNMRALKTAAMFTSGNAARDVLRGVKVFGPDLFVATNSYIMGMVDTEQRSPVNVVERVMDETRDRNYTTANEPLIPAKLIDEAAKLGGARLKGGWNLTVEMGVHEGTAEFEYGGFVTTTGDVGDVSKRVSDRLIVGDYPRVSSLVKPGRPQGVADIGLSSTFVEIICKAARTLTGGTAKRDESGTPIVFHGGEDEMKPVYWSAQGEHGTLVALQMPVRGSGIHDWGADKAEAVAA